MSWVAPGERAKGIAFSGGMLAALLTSLGPMTPDNGGQDMRVTVTVQYRGETYTTECAASGFQLTLLAQSQDTDQQDRNTAFIAANLAVAAISDMQHLLNPHGNQAATVQIL